VWVLARSRPSSRSLFGGRPFVSANEANTQDIRSTDFSLVEVTHLFSMSTTKPFTGFANRGNRSSANGSLGFKPGEMVKIEGIFQDGKTAPFMLDKHGHVSVSGGELFYGSNTKKQKGWFSAKSVDISYKHGNEASAEATVTLSAKQQEHLKKQFSQLDSDNSGSLSVAEIQIGMRAFGQDLNRQQAQELVHMVKFDHSSSEVTFEEFSEMVRLKLESAKRKQHHGKRKSAIVIQRAVRRWLTSMTLPQPVPGPKLIAWARHYNKEGAQKAEPYLQAAMIEQETIRAEQWEHLKAKNEERRSRLAARRNKLEAKIHGDKASNNPAEVMKNIMVEIFTEVVDQVAINIAEEVTGKRIGDAAKEELGSKDVVSKSTLQDIGKAIKASKIITEIQKNGASGVLYHVKSREQVAALLCGVLKGSPPQTLLKQVNAAAAVVPGATVKNADRKLYSDAVTASRASEPHKTAALAAIQSIGTHAVVGDMLLCIVRGLPPLKINSFIKGNPMTRGESPIKSKSLKSGGLPKGDKRASAETLMEFHASVASADAWLSYTQQSAVNIAKDEAKTECQIAGVLSAVLMNQDARFIRRQMAIFGTDDSWGNDVVMDGWKTTDKNAVIDLCKRCELSTSRVITLTKAIKSSTAKSEVINVLTELLGCLSRIKIKDKEQAKAAMKSSKRGKAGGRGGNSGTAGGKASVQQVNVSKRKIDQSPAVKPADVAAAVSNIMFIDRLTAMQRRGAKLAMQNSETLADIVICYANLIQLASPEKLEESISNYGDAPRSTQDLCLMMAKCASQSPLFSDKVKKGVTEALKICKTHAAIISVIGAGIAKKTPTEIMEAPSILSDAEKTAFLSILHKCKECHTHPQMMDIAKKCATNIACYGEQATILTSILIHEDPKVLRKNANVSSVDGTRKRTDINDKERDRTINAFEKSILHESQKDILMEGLGYIKTHEQLCQLLSAAVLNAPATLIEKLVTPWAPASQPHRTIKTGNVEFILLEPHQMKSAINIIDAAPSMAPGDKKMAKEVLGSAKTHVHVAAVFTAIVAGRSQNKFRKALYDTSEHLQSDNAKPAEKDRILAAIKSSRFAGAKRNAAVECIKNTKKSTVITAALGALIAEKSPFQILNSSILGIEKKLNKTKVKTEDELQAESQNAARQEFAKKYGAVSSMCTLSDAQKTAGMDTLMKCNLPNQRLEVLLRVYEHCKPEEIIATLQVKNLNRSLTEGEKQMVIDRISFGPLDSDKVSAAVSMIKSASTKAEAENILVQAISWCNLVSEADKASFLKTVEATKFLTKEKKTYAQQWLKKVDTKSRLLTMIQALLRWQIRPLHWVGIAYEEIFQQQSLPVFSNDVKIACVNSIKDCKSSDKQKKAGTKAVEKAVCEADLSIVLLGLLEDLPPEVLKTLVEKKPKEKRERKTMSAKYSKKKDKHGKKHGSEAAMNDDQSGDEEDEAAIIKANEDEEFYESIKNMKLRDDGGRGSFGNLKARSITRIRTNRDIAPNMNEALVIVGEKISKMDELEVYNRISRLLSRRDRVLDLTAKTDQASMIFLNLCFALIDNDPEIEFTEAREEKKKLLAMSKTCLEAITCVWTEKEKEEGPRIFVFKASKNLDGSVNEEYDTSCVLSQNDKHEIITYLERDAKVSDEAIKNTVFKGIVQYCKTRKEALVLMDMYDKGESARAIAAECRRYAAQGSMMGSAVKTKKVVVDNVALQQALANDNREAAEAILSVAELLGLSDYQRATAVRLVNASKNVIDRASILQATLAAENPKIMRSAAKSQHGSVDKAFLTSLIEKSSFNEDAKSVGIMETAEIKTQEDRCRVLITTFLAAKKIHDASVPDDNGEEDTIPSQIPSKQRVAMAKSLATMKSFNSKERLAVKEAMSKLTTYRQLSYVLLEIIRKGSRKSMVKAATCKQDENATIEVEHIEEVKAAVQQSHMMEILHGDHHRDIEENIQAANTYPALAKALLAFIQCYSTIVDEVHATVQDVIADKDSTSPKPTYKGRKVVSEEPKVNDEPEPLATVLKSQHIRINASIAHFPHASAPIRKLAARQAATATTVAHLVDISLLFLQKVIEGTETAISRYEDSLKKIKFTAEKAEGYVDNELGVSDECTMTECLILREIALGMPQLSNREIAASQARAMKSKQEMLDLIEVILKEPIFGSRKMQELSSYSGVKSAVYSGSTSAGQKTQSRSPPASLNGSNEKSAWDEWGTHNISEFVDDSDEEIPAAPQVYVGNQKPTQPIGKPSKSSPLKQDRVTRSFSPIQTKGTHLRRVQASAASYGAAPTTPPLKQPVAKSKSEKNMVDPEQRQIKKALKVCNGSVGRRLLAMHKRKLLNILVLSKTGVLVELAKLPDTMEQRVLKMFEKQLLDKQRRVPAAKVLQECIDKERYAVTDNLTDRTPRRSVGSNRY
jgi:hypothetical protein